MPRKNVQPFSAFISEYFTSFIVVLSIVLGFLFPQVGMIWKSYLTLLLMFLMFFIALSMRLGEIADTVRNYPVIVTGLFTTFILVPVLALFTKPFFSPIIFVGTLLALCCPSAIVSAFWTKVFKGDVATALVMSIITNLLSIVTIPATMLIAVGTALNVDVSSMIANLAEIILVPMIASFLIRRFIHLDWDRASSYGSRVELGILALVIWGSVAPGVAYVSKDIPEFALLNAFLLGILALGFTLTHFFTKRFGHDKEISIEIATVVKNAALSLVIGLTTKAFGPQILPPLIANLIAQNVLLIPAKALTTERQTRRQAGLIAKPETLETVGAHACS
jgi:predicted Na+-dependent transporter